MGYFQIALNFQVDRIMELATYGHIQKMQIMHKGFILGLIYAFLAYRDLMRAEGPKHIPIY